MSNDLKTIKISEEYFKKLKEAQKLLIFEGINKLNTDIKKEINKNFEKLTLGLIIGVGATLLVQALSED